MNIQYIPLLNDLLTTINYPTHNQSHCQSSTPLISAIFALAVSYLPNLENKD